MAVHARSEWTRQGPAGAVTAASDNTGFVPVSALDFDTDGAALYEGAALSSLAAIETVIAGFAQGRAGIRLSGIPVLVDLLADGPIVSIVADYLGPAARPVRAILFDKTAATNWALGWHQDRTIVVRERHDTSGFGPWTTKAGLQHVEPTFSVIESMVTLRVHLDDVTADNAPLLIAPGSHRFGRIMEPEIAATIERCGTIACLARRGDVWAYSTPIIHASAASVTAGHRRVLQIDYSAETLPFPLEWLGV